MKLPISAIILTYNEEKNIQACLDSVKDFVQDIFIVDSFSTDRTLEIAKKYTDKIFQHEFENYGEQRNWALNNLPIKTELILNLDADHRISNELKEELFGIFSSGRNNDVNGYLISRKTIFMGRWIKYGGHFPVYHGILFRKNYGICEESLYDQHFVIKGKVKKLKNTVNDVVAESLSAFIERHNQWASFEANSQLMINSDQKTRLETNIFGNSMERRRFFKNKVYMKLPVLIRPFMYFFYRYFLKLGFLDGKEGLIFHFLQGFWFRFLVDAKICEMKKLPTLKGNK